MIDPDAMIRCRLLLDDGTVLADDIVRAATVVAISQRHEILARPHVAAGRMVRVEASDPDGLVPTLVMEVSSSD
jgi:hypothetical protein